MSETLHPAAHEHIPSFVTAPGETDVLMVISALLLIGGIFAFGIFFFRIHSLPERLAHKGHKLQFEIVAVLCLIALFTHVHLFWVAALLLALIDLPDLSVFNRIAGSVEKMADSKESSPSEGPPDGVSGHHQPQSALPPPDGKDEKARIRLAGGAGDG
jgi:hypothetical protein